MREHGRSHSEIPGGHYIPDIPIDTEPPLSLGSGGSEITAPGCIPETSDSELPAPEDIMVSEQATVIDGRISSTVTHYYEPGRASVGVLGNTVAPQIAQELGEDEVFTVLDAGTGTGRGAWSLASVLQINGVNYHIDAVDANPLAIAKAVEPQYERSAMLDGLASAWEGVPPEAADYLAVSPGQYANVRSLKTVMPAQALRERVTFHQADLRQPLPLPGRYKAALLNGVLSAYEDPRRSQKHVPNIHRIIGTVAAQLDMGGLLTVDDNWASSPLDAERTLDQHGLVRERNDYGIPFDLWHKLNIFRKVAHIELQRPEA